jgi:ubiquitin C-terminal hydrolase
MTPKEKAIELYKKLVIHIQRYDEYVDERSKINTKKCALIAVDEMINVIKDLDNWAYIYWVEVKKEIQNL